MKKIIILLILTINYQLLTINYCFCQSWLWANSGGSIFPYDEGSSICQDKTGNIYVVGDIQGSLPQQEQNHYAIFNSDTVPVPGMNALFLAKYNPNGNQLWVKSFGGVYDNWNNPNSNTAAEIIYNPTTNSIYVTGEVNSSCYIGTHEIGDMFLAKFDLNGNCIWAKSFGSGNIYDEVGPMCFTPSGKILVAGVTQFNGTFDTINLPKGSFLAMYDDNGKCHWAKNIFTGKSYTPIGGAAGQILSIKIYNNDIFLTAAKHSDSLYVDTVLLTGKTAYSSVLARFDSLGNVKWIRQILSPGYTINGELSMDKNGNCYIVTNFFDYAIINADTISASSNRDDLLIVKYDKNGNFLWYRHNKNIGYDATSSDSIGNVYIAGCFSGNVSFGNYNVTANTSQDFYVTRYNTNGDCLGVLHAGYGIACGVLSGMGGACFVTGSFGPSQAGQWAIQLGSTLLTTHGYEDYFIAKASAITGIEEPKKLSDNQMLIYSNPTTGKCNIIVPSDFLNEKNLTLSIYDNTGNLIQKKTLEMNNGKIKLDLDAEAKGVYNAVLSNGKKSYSGKIVFE